MLCPNHSSPEYKALEEAGLKTFEIYKYWADHNNTLGTPEEVQYYNLSDEEKAFLLERNSWTEEDIERMNLEGPQPEIDPASIVDVIPKAVRTTQQEPARALTPLSHFKKYIKLHKKEVSDLNKNMILKRVDQYNAKYGTRHYIPFSPVGQSNLWRAGDIIERWNGFNPLQGDIFTSFYRYDNVEEAELEQDNAWTNETARRLITRLTAGSNIKVMYTDTQGASRATQGTANPYNGEPVFFLGDTIYVVTDKLTPNMVFHEFSHPIIRTIFKTTPELFNKLYQELSGTSEGQAIISTVKRIYPELGDTDMFKEEVIVRALADKATALRNDVKTTPQFNNIISRILYHIKQFFRKIFKEPIRPENLDVNTTIEQLANMLVNDRFVIDPRFTKSDIAAYLREENKLHDELFGAGLEAKIQPYLKHLWAVTLKEKVRAFESKNYPEMFRLVKTEFGLPLLEDIRKKIYKHKDIITDKIKDDIERTKVLNEQVMAFIRSLYQLQTIVKNFAREAKILHEGKRTTDDVARIQFIIEATNYFDSFLNDDSTGVATQLSRGLPEESDLMNLMNDITRKIKDIKNTADPIRKEGMDLMLTDILKKQSERVEKIYVPMIEGMKKRGESKANIKALEDEYERLRMTPGKIKDMLSGMGDADQMNNFLEGWLYSSDEIVGGMGVFFKNTYNTIQANTQARYTEFLDKIVPMAEAAGINVKSLGELAGKLLFLDTKGVWENGDLVKQEVWTFLTKYKDYRWDVQDLKNRIAKAEEAFNRTNTDEDKDALNKLKLEKVQLDKFFFREFTDEFYERTEVFNSPIGQEAKRRRDSLYQQINALESKPESEAEYFEVEADIKELRKQLRQLYSLKDLNDEYKVDTEKDPALSIARILQLSRDINRNYFDYKLIPGKFQEKLSEYEQDLVNQKIVPGTKEFENKRQQWIDANTVQVVKPEFYQKTNQIYSEIKAIYDSIPNPSKEALELASIYKDIRDTLSGYRDENGQPVGTDMSSKTIAKIKSLQERADKLNKKIRAALTPEQEQILESLEYQMASGQQLSQKQVDLYNSLSDKLPSQGGLDKWQRARLSALWQELATLQGKEPTDYYIDIFNNFMEKLPQDLKERIIDINKEFVINKSSADFIINLPGDLLKDMLESVPGFKDWFKANHLRKSYWNVEQSRKVTEWVRVASWSVTRPLDPDYLERTTIKDLEGNFTTIEGRPSGRFYERYVKDEFRTKEIIGETVDVFGNFLPRTMLEGAPDNKYVNPEYLRLSQADPKSQDGKLFTLLEKVKEMYLDAQKDSDPYAQLGYDFPRVRKTTSEAILSGDMTKAVGTYWNNFKDFFRKVKDDPDSGYNLRDEIMFADEPYFNTSKEREIIPVSGIYNLEKEQVSMDFFRSIAVYMGGLERERHLRKILPFFKATLDVLADPVNTVRNLDNVERRNWRTRYQNAPPMRTRSGRVYVSNRFKALNNKVQREFFGQVNTGIFRDNKGVNALINASFRGASLSYLAIQLPSAVANMFVQVVQNVIKTSSGEVMSPSELAQGSIWAGKASYALTAEAYSTDPHSVDVQLIEIFDSVPGRTAQSLGRSPGRSLIRDFVSFSWLYAPRKFMENYATLQAFGAMMSHIKVKQTLNGVTKEIRYLDAWELVDNKIALKKGIDPAYAQGGAEFNNALNMMQNVQHDMNGAYDAFSQPEAYRYILYRVFAFLRRYVTTMLTNRFAFTRNSPAIMGVKTGFYTATAKALFRGLRDPRYFKNLSGPEIAASRQFITEMGLVALMYFMYNLFGWDPEDDERYAKLREKSGPLPAPFVPETEYPFHPSGWLSNHALLQLIKIKDQTQMWIPLPGFGLKDYTSLFSMTPIAVGPTIDLYAKSVDNTIRWASGDDRAYYQRTVGPYQWQQEGSPKVLNYLFQVIGMRGALITPELAIEKTEQAKVLK